MSFLSNMIVTGILCSFRKAKENEEDKKVSESLKLQFL